MAIEVWEMFTSQGGKKSTGKGSNRKLSYGITGTDDDATIVGLAESLAPAEMGELVRDDISKTQLGPQFWQADINYIDPEKQEEKKKRPQGEMVASFDTTGGTQHVTVSLETTGKAVRSGSIEVEDFNKAIEVTEDGVNGTDVVVPMLQIEMSVKLDHGTITLEYVRTLRDMTGTTNDAEFYGFAKGELLFLGARGTQSSQGDVQVSFMFAAGKKITSSTFAPGFVDPDTQETADLTKNPHDHVWFFFKREEGESSIVHRPQAVFVERLYEESDFADLGIGTSEPEPEPDPEPDPEP